MMLYYDIINYMKIIFLFPNIFEAIECGRTILYKRLYNKSKRIMCNYAKGIFLQAKADCQLKLNGAENYLTNLAVSRVSHNLISYLSRIVRRILRLVRSQREDLREPQLFIHVARRPISLEFTADCRRLGKR